MGQTQIGPVCTQQTDICETATSGLVGHNTACIVSLHSPVDPCAQQRPKTRRAPPGQRDVDAVRHGAGPDNGDAQRRNGSLDMLFHGFLPVIIIIDL